MLFKPLFFAGLSKTSKYCLEIWQHSARHLTYTFQNETDAFWKKGVVAFPQATTVEDLKKKYLPADGGGFYYDHRIIVRKYPEKYTVEALETRRTGGIDPVTKHRKYKRIGGGIKKTWLWVDLKRFGPKTGEPMVERVIKILDSDCHSAKIALVGHADCLRYILATENMKPGDLIRNSGVIPLNPVRAYEGDAYPVGALPSGTVVSCIEALPGQGARYCINAGGYGTVQSKSDGRCVIKIASKKRSFEISIKEECMVVVGRLSNIDHNKKILGSAVALRRLGYRPRSGLWHRKTGRFGRKIRPPPPIKVITEEEEDDLEKRKIRFTWHNFVLEK